jgi:hypothetical protein
MKTPHKILIGIFGTLFLISFALGVFGFIRGLQSYRDARVVPEETNLPADIAEYIKSKRDLIVVRDPRPLSVISSPLTVRGQARGTWYFEADFPIILVDWDGRIIAESYASALLDPSDPESTWMTAEFVPFEGTIEFDNPSWDADFSKRGWVIFAKDNPSGLPEHDDALEIPILFE